MNVRHNKVGESEEPAMYRINDELVIPLIRAGVVIFIDIEIK